MTPKEALMEIIDYGIEMNAGDYVDVEALKVATKALEKQVAIKPNFDVRDMFYKCPACGVGLLFSDEIPRADDREGLGPPIDNYCSVCGQKIDWKGINEE